LIEKNSKYHEASISSLAALSISHNLSLIESFLLYRYCTTMSKKADENYCYDDKEEEEEEEEDRKCPPQRFPSLNPNNEWAASHTPEERASATAFKHGPREPSMKLHEDKKEANIHKKKHRLKQHQHLKQSSTEISERHEGQRNIAPKHEAVAIEEDVLFDEKEEIKGELMDMSLHPINTSCG
jgi:hypothetical protein